MVRSEGILIAGSRRQLRRFFRQELALTEAYPGLTLF
jgi:hypothetical protein